MVKNSVEGDRSTPKVLSLDNEPNQQKLAMDPIRMLDNRLDILEESMVKMTSLLTNTATLQNQHKREITLEIQRLANSISSTPVCQDFQAQEKLLLDKNTQINKLTKTIDQMQINKEMEQKQLKQEKELNNLDPEASNQSDLQVKSTETTRPTDIPFRDNDSALKFPSKEASESPIIANQKLPQVNKKSGNDNTKTVNFDFLFLHDSICNFIDILKLLSGSVYDGIKHTSYTIEKTREFISSLQHARTLLLHVGINNLKKESADAVVRKFVLMVDEALKKVDTAQLTENHKYNPYVNSHSIQGRDGRQSSEPGYTEDHKRHDSNQRINDLASTIASAVAGAFRDFV
ncbi:unnamed protein product [Mytilus coruscus]|uniref:Uncharacterized protein n=1 Tax=Mytilus coruscus TaxID=42192 RepID=A0A6J8D5P3_MYTCO|nr:unnamed protein product [Mytilus coruscus]